MIEKITLILIKIIISYIPNSFFLFSNGNTKHVSFHPEMWNEKSGHKDCHAFAKFHWRAGRSHVMENVESGKSHNVQVHAILGTPPVPSPLTPKPLVRFPVPCLPR